MSGEPCVKYNECRYVYKGNNIIVDTNFILYLINCILLETQEANLNEYNPNVLFSDFKTRLTNCIQKLVRCTPRNKFVISEQIGNQLNSRHSTGTEYYRILSENNSIIPPQERNFRDIDRIIGSFLNPISVLDDEIDDLKLSLSGLKLKRFPDEADLSLIISALKTSSDSVSSVIVTEDGSLIHTIREVYSIGSIELNSVRYNSKNIAEKYIPTYLDGPHQMCCFDTDRFLKMYIQTTSGYNLVHSDQIIKRDKIIERKTVERTVQESIRNKYQGVSS